MACLVDAGGAPPERAGHVQRDDGDEEQPAADDLADRQGQEHDGGRAAGQRGDDPDRRREPAGRRWPARTSAARGGPSRARTGRGGATGAPSWPRWPRRRRRHRPRRAPGGPSSGGPRASAVAKNRTIVSGVCHAGRPGTTYRRADANTPAAPATAATGARAGTSTAPTATAAYSESRATSRLSHDRRRLRRAFHAAIGRPRCPSAPTMPAPARAAASSRSAVRAGGGADAEGDLADEREPHERPVRLLGPQVPVAGRVGVDRHVPRQLDAGGRHGQVARRQRRGRRPSSGRPATRPRSPSRP